MSHSHLPIQHLLKQMETYGARRFRRDVRPDWLTEFIHSAAELFEPLAEVGRVGFDCQAGEDCWEVGLYLGSTEVVGGKDDGRDRHTAFLFDLLALQACFDHVHSFRWTAIPPGLDDGKAPARCFVTLEGRISEHSVRLHVYSIPPAEAGPGFREYPDGRCEAVEVGSDE